MTLYVLKGLRHGILVFLMLGGVALAGAKSETLEWYTPEQTVLGTEHYLIHPFSARGDLSQLLPQVRHKYGQQCTGFQQYLRVEQNYYFLSQGQSDCLLQLQQHEQLFHGVLSIRHQAMAESIALQPMWQSLGWRVTWQHCSHAQDDRLLAQLATCFLLLEAAPQALVQALRAAQWQEPSTTSGTWLGPRSQRLAVHALPGQQRVLLQCFACD